MRASLLIAAHNEGESLWKTIRACVETTTGLPYEIIVSDDASSDGSVEDAAKRFPQIRVVRQEHRVGASPTKHAAALEAQGEILVFLDGHTNPEFGTIKRLVEDVERLEGKAIITPAIPHLNTTHWLNSRSQIGHGYSVELNTLACRWLSLRELKVHDVGRQRFHESPALIGCALAISQELYQLLNGFDADMRYWGVEDIDFGMKSVLMGHPILLDPLAVVGHRFRQSFDNYTVPAEHVIANHLRFARKHFTSAVWSQWVQACRARSDAPLPDHPEGLWARAWQIFEERRASVEQERHFLHSRRVHDEFWYAEKCCQTWPCLAAEGNATPQSNPVPRGEARDSDTEKKEATSASQRQPSDPVIFKAPMQSLLRPFALPLLSPSPSPPPNMPNTPPTPPCDTSNSSCCAGGGGSGAAGAAGAGATAGALGGAAAGAASGLAGAAGAAGAAAGALFGGGGVSSPPRQAAAATNNPVQYSNGMVILSAVDIASNGFGTSWQHERTYCNQLSVNADVGQGFNWLVTTWPYLTADPAGTITLVRGTVGSLWFDPSGSNYVGRYGTTTTLSHDNTTHLFTLTYADGTQQQFQDFTQLTNPPGLLYRQIEAGGAVTQVTAYTTTNNIQTIQRTGVDNGTTVTEEFVYTYDANLRLVNLLLQQKVGGGAWQNVRQVAYDYHPGTDAFGSAGDLRTVTIQIPNGSSWSNSAITYYRYYVSGASNGFVHGLSYVVQPATYAKMIAASINPITASNAVVSTYADFAYQYDSSQRVTQEQIDGGSRTFSYAYTPGTTSSDYNVWAMKTVETRPDGNQRTVYTNNLGQSLIDDLSSGSDHWITASHYDGQAHLIWQASPSAVISYDDTSTSLNILLRTSSGLINQTNYYTSTGSGAAAGYVSSITLSQGSGGTPIVLKSYQYTSQTASGVTVYPVSQETVYKNTDGTGAITTSYSYTYYSGTTQIQQQTTTLPVISTGQNGSGVAATRLDYFDTNGRRIWAMDERGFISQFVFQLLTGGLLQGIDDYDTTQTGNAAPSGWTTPTGGGLNLISDYQIDNLGRMIQTLGPTHTIDLSGTATAIRRANWAVYDDVNFTTYTGNGYATGSAPSYSYTLINPVAILITDAQGRPLELISATRGSGTTSSGPMVPTDTYAQSSYVRWTTIQYLDCCLIASQRVYKLIPSSGVGVSGTNYDETDFGYDVMKRRDRTVTPGGTITDLVFDPRGLVLSTWLGTDDTGATPTDPSGGGATGNNMVVVTGYVYDGGSSGGDGNLTQQTDYVDATATLDRVTNLTYDFRDRLITTDGEIDYFQLLTYDNLDRITLTQRYDTTASGNLIMQSASNFDDQNRVYQSIQYGVDPTTGTVGNSLTDSFWYDASGNQVKSFPAGSQLFTKTTFDSLGRAAVRYTAYGPDSTYADAFSVANNTVVRQDETTYDDASNVIQITVRERYHNAAASQAGALTDPSGTPAARVSYFATYPDPLGRIVNAANYGTNAGSALSRPSTAPTPSDSILVDSTSYDAAGTVSETIDPAAKVIAYVYDDRGREIQVTDNSGGTSVTGLCTSSDDTNQTIQYTYTPDDNLATQVAVNSRTTNQTTTYTYGTTLSDSTIATSSLLRYVDYPTSTGGPGGSDSVALTWNRQQQQVTLSDQRGCVHSYFYDLLARLTNDCVTTLGSGVDNAVLQLASQYEVRGMISGLTSYASATPNSGSIVNDVQLAYNAFAQIVSDTQSHSGAVVVGTTPMVQYDYADGSTNTVRPQTLTYPDGRVVTIGYGASGGINDSCSRVDNLTDPSATLVNYSYLGLNTTVQVTYPQPGIQYTLLGSSSGTSPAGDIYWGLDLFSRIIDSRWYNTSSNDDVDRILYGYDRASNRIWRQNPVATAAGAQFDEFYVNDGLQRLKQMQRGTLNSTNTGITSPTFGQCWTLDPTGNWMGFNEASSGGSWTTVQTRTANAVNEITAITNTTGSPWTAPAYDAAGNMTTMPQPASPDDSYTATYDAWNRLMALVDTTTSSTVQQCQYDARNFRTICITPAISETRHCYYSNAWQSLEERVGTATTADRQFVWGTRYIDDLVLRDQGSQRFYAFQDANWNVTSISDTAGTIQERYAYTAFGSATFLNSTFTEQSSSDFDWGVLYCGYLFAAGTGIALVRFRSYHTLLGVWAARDPLKHRRSSSLYTYTRSSPLSSTDPLGLQDNWWIWSNDYSDWPPEDPEYTDQPWTHPEDPVPVDMPTPGSASGLLSGIPPIVIEPSSPVGPPTNQWPILSGPLYTRRFPLPPPEGQLVPFDPNIHKPWVAPEPGYIERMMNQPTPNRNMMGGVNTRGTQIDIRSRGMTQQPRCPIPLRGR